ncbi:MAG: hypothetical protein NVSMB57_03470 [Actinomycetota bacterium]
MRVTGYARPDLCDYWAIESESVMDVGGFADVVLEDSLGVSHRLGDFWDRRPVVVAFLRHFG